MAYAPLVLVVMNAVYALAAYPFGKLSDSMKHPTLLMLGLAVLITADLSLAYGNHAGWVWAGISLWGLHMGMSQGLLATMVAQAVPEDLRGTGFGMFYVISGLSMLVASALAGLLWDRWGAPATFLAGAAFGALALAAMLIRPANRGDSVSR
jgi:MFS family permease